MSQVLPVVRRHAVAFAALFLLLGGTAFAVTGRPASPSSSRTMSACVTSAHRTLNLITAGRACPEGQQRVSWDVKGPRGLHGAAGTTGGRGTTGTAGPTGDTGQAGPQGDAGARGLPGETGPAGHAGSDGAKGDTGATGPAGPAGTTGPAGSAGPTGPAGPAAFAQFFALMPAENASTVAPGTDVDFGQDGPTSGDIWRTSASAFLLPSAGVYRVAFTVPVTEAGQLLLTLDGADLPYTVVGRATGTTQIAGESLVRTTSPGSVLTVRNPAGSSTALTITPFAGGTRPASASLIVERLRAGT